MKYITTISGVQLHPFLSPLSLFKTGVHSRVGDELRTAASRHTVLRACPQKLDGVTKIEILSFLVFFIFFHPPLTTSPALLIEAGERIEVQSP